MKRAQTALFALMLASLLLVGCGRQGPNETGASNDPLKQSSPMNSNSPSISANSIVGPVNYVALGDSTGAGVGAKEGGYVARLFKRIVARRPASELTNLCVSGATTSDVLRNQLSKALRDDVNLVTLGIGINDVGHGFSVEQFSKNYEEILIRLKQSTKATIIVTNIPDISSAPRIPEIIRAEYQRSIVEFNQRLEEIAARHDVIVFDVHTTTREQLPLHPEFFSADGFHPSDAGYEFWAEQMWPTVARAIGE